MPPFFVVYIGESHTMRIQLTLPEVLGASGIQKNNNPPKNSFELDNPNFEQAKLKIEIAREADQQNPWYTKEITIRNAPWVHRSRLVWRNDRREVDVYVKNLGGPGEFTVPYRLVRFEKNIDFTTNYPMNSGTQDAVVHWHSPDEPFYLEKGEFFTDTYVLPNDLSWDRYLLEVYAVKKQNYVQFEKPEATWEDLNSIDAPWLFGRDPFDLIIFVESPGIEINTTIQKGLDLLRDKQGIDLGFPIGSEEEIESHQKTQGLRQSFQKGDIYVYNGQAYALYGPILEHYKDLGGAQSVMLGLPISSIEVVTSSSGITGTMMKFEGPELEESKDEPAAIYASEKGIAATWPWIGRVYSQDHGGHSGWLGFPLADEQHYGTNSTLQMFEYGYIVYHYPEVAAGEYDWSRPPVAYPYLASRGTLFDVQAQQGWQNTGIQLQAGNRITVIQVGGSWSYVGESFFDANGDPNADIEEEHREILILPSSYVGTLVGRIGENNDRIFPLGRWSEFTADTEGTLYLAMNDIDHKDNSGAITVEIMVESAE